MEIRSGYVLSTKSKLSDEISRLESGSLKAEIVVVKQVFAKTDMLTQLGMPPILNNLPSKTKPTWLQA